MAFYLFGWLLLDWAQGAIDERVERSKR